MIKKKILTSFFLMFYVFAFSQKGERIDISKEDPHNLYNFEQNESTELFYIRFVPKTKPKACLVILPGAGELVENVIEQINLHKLAVEKDILVVFPSLNWGTTKFIEEHKFLDKVFKNVIQQYQIPQTKFIIGGLSGGGMVSMRYAERANENIKNTYIKPKAVFAIDSPLDFSHLYQQSERDIERNFSEAAVNESKWLIDRYNSEFGGSPKDVPLEYVKNSIYSQSEKDGGNAKFLSKTPIIIYTEPAIQWQMKNRQRDLYDLNCTDISAMINLLQIRGNKEAELVVTHNKGIRPNGTKHPHSWSIMDSDKMLNWILEKLK
jgi:pimeloyl-ACP methyl ester carboxylesterase|tara:strand:- start:930 stop:1892 length:963 start_codon:yes stop_codon:yes gene_type:complete